MIMDRWVLVFCSIYTLYLRHKNHTHNKEGFLGVISTAEAPMVITLRLEKLPLKNLLLFPSPMCLLQAVSNSLWWSQHKGLSVKVLIQVSLWFRLTHVLTFSCCVRTIVMLTVALSVWYNTLITLARRKPPSSSSWPSQDLDEIQQPWFWAYTSYQSALSILSDISFAWECQCADCAWCKQPARNASSILLQKMNKQHSVPLCFTVCVHTVVRPKNLICSSKACFVSTLVKEKKKN